MKRIGRVTLIAFALTATVFGQEQQQTKETEASSAPSLGEAKPLIDAMTAIGSIIAGADKTDEAAATVAPEAKPADTTLGYEGEKKSAEDKPSVAKKPRSTKNSVILVTSGAAAGAAIGASMGKGSKGAMIGAAVGGAVGLVYDRMTHKNPGKI